jgi:hypothetical protein
LAHSEQVSISIFLLLLLYFVLFIIASDVLNVMNNVMLLIMLIPLNIINKGKTVCLVEYIRQVLREAENENKEVHILICAPTNSATDIFALKLITILSPEEMFRLYAFHRRKATGIILSMLFIVYVSFFLSLSIYI